MRLSLNRYLLITCAVALAGLSARGEQTAPGASAESLTEQKQALSVLQSYVGSWRGVGQPKRGSTQGAWIEQLDWSWRFKEGRATLVFDAPQGKFFTSGELSPSAERGQFRLLGTLPDGARESYGGALNDDGRLVLQAEHPAADRPARITLSQVAGGDRMLMLYERPTAAKGQFMRLAEVGFTRKGSGFGQGTTYRECVVTGGLGTIPVEHKGQTWYVCCTGCRELFVDTPDDVLADYRTRKAEEKQRPAK